MGGEGRFREKGEKAGHNNKLAERTCVDVAPEARMKEGEVKERMRLEEEEEEEKERRTEAGLLYGPGTDFGRQFPFREELA